MKLIDVTDPQYVTEIANRLNLNGKVWCFMAGMHPHPRMNTYLLGVAVLGEAGWQPLVQEGFDTYGEASNLADTLNKHFPYSAESCIAIIADTMSRSRLKQEQDSAHPHDRVYRVKVTFANEGRANLHEDDVIDAIRERLEEEDVTYGIESAEVELK